MQGMIVPPIATRPTLPHQQPWQIAVLFSNALAPHPVPGTVLQRIFTVSAIKGFDEAMGEAQVFAAALADIPSAQIHAIKVFICHQSNKSIDWPLPAPALARDDDMRRFVVAWEDEGNPSSSLEFFEASFVDEDIGKVRGRALGFARKKAATPGHRVVYIHGYCHNRWHELDHHGKLPSCNPAPEVK